MGEDWIAFGAGGPKCKVAGHWKASYAGIFLCGSGDAGIGICWTTHVQSTNRGCTEDFYKKKIFSTTFFLSANL